MADSSDRCHILGRCFAQWRAWIRPLVIALYLVILVIVLPLLIVNLGESDATSYEKAWFIGGLFVLLGLPISIWEITQHLVHYTKPHLQKHIIRILWMVPIYAINAWFGLLLPNVVIYADTIRECYEAYVIYNFLMFLLNFLKDSVDVETHFVDRPSAKPLCICCCLPSCKMGSSLIENCKQGILQYTVIRPITSVIAFVCFLLGCYGESSFQVNVAYPYLAAINQMSQFGAMYSLAFFYKVHQAELAPMKPLSKFLCIKAIVFFSFLQEVVIAILVDTGVIRKTPNGDVESVKRLSSDSQNFLLCIEMLLAAVGHMYAFSHKPYVYVSVDGEVKQNPSCWHSFKAMWDVSDVQKDVSNHFGFIAKSMRRSSHAVASELCSGGIERLNIRKIQGLQEEDVTGVNLRQSSQFYSDVTVQLSADALNYQNAAPVFLKSTDLQRIDK